MPFGNRKIYFEDFFSSVLSQLKMYHSSVNLKFNYLGIFQSLKLRILMGKVLSISLKLNFTPNTLGCYGLIWGSKVSEERCARNDAPDFWRRVRQRKEKIRFAGKWQLEFLFAGRPKRPATLRGSDGFYEPLSASPGRSKAAEPVPVVAVTAPAEK